MIRVQDVHNLKEEGSERYLIDRQWPKGVVRAILHKEKSGAAKKPLAEFKWRPQLAPQPETWAWLQNNPDKIDQFRRRYFQELERKKRYWLPIVHESRKNEITLLCDTKEVPWTPAQFFKEFLDIQAGRMAGSQHAEPTGTSGQGLSIPVGKVESRKSARPLKKEMRFESNQKLKFSPAEKRRVL